MPIKKTLLVSFFIGFHLICISQIDESKKHLINYLCVNETLNYLDNVDDVLAYQIDKIKYSGFLLSLDKIILINSNLYYARYKLVGTNFYLRYLIDTKKIKAVLINYGYDGFERVKIGAWQNFNQLNNSILSGKNNKQKIDFFLDYFYMPTTYCAFRYSDNSYSFIKRDIVDLCMNIELPEKCIKKKDEYYLVKDELVKKITIEINEKNQIKINDEGMNYSNTDFGVSRNKLGEIPVFR